MSGGAFDYYQYHIDDIITRIEHEIDIATCERPPLIESTNISVCQIHDEDSDGFRSYSYLTRYQFKNMSEARQHFNHLGYELCNLDEDSFTATLENTKLLIKHYHVLEYLDENGVVIYFPDYTPETIEELKNGIDILKKASVYAQRIDWLLSGDDSEKSFHKRLKEDLDELNNIEHDNK